MEGATLISTRLLVDVDVGSFSLYKYVSTAWAKYIKTIVKGTPSLGNPSYGKLDFSPPSLTVAAALLVAVPSSCTSSFVYSSLELFVHEDMPPSAFFRRSAPCLAGMPCVPCNYSPYASQHVLRSVRASPYISD